MIDFKEIARILRPIKNKIFLLIGRGTVTSVSNSTGHQKISITALDNEILSDVERFQEYGIESNPLIDGNDEVLILFINGNREQGKIICQANRKYRPSDLSPGDVCIYAKSGLNESMNRITIKSTTNAIEIKTKDNNIITIDSVGIDITDKNNNNIAMTATGVNVNNGNLEVSI